MQRSITQKFFYPQPPQTVWEYLTKAELMSQWLMENDFEPILGYDFQFRIKPIPQFEFDGIIYCKVLEIVPFRKLSYTWKAGPGDGQINLDSIVTWTLVPKDNGTELLLDHSGRMENADIYSAMNTGWQKNMAKMDTLIQAAQHGSNPV
ncbi:MAG TPA: SRPBCC domain-containing protein [Puia sp.]|nr:SRPBCC domain-containing protein [Puia sp.]